jgi:phenol 2-monooxygenase
VAEKYISDNCVILAGDAAHTHSSAAAQGMNTGVHDAVNLAWKLGGVLRGWYNKDILQTYEEERRPIAQELIRQDKEISSLIIGDIPDEFKNSGLTAHELVTHSITANAQFALGFGVHYNGSKLNAAPSITSLVAGRRAPDVLLQKPKSRLPVRLQQLTPNTGAFWFVVFAGSPLLTGGRLLSLRSHLDSAQSFTKKAHAHAIHFMTIISGVKSQGEVALGVKRFGNVYYDADSSAHNIYGISEGSGGVVVLRPDGILSFAVPLTGGEDLSSYFSTIIRDSEVEKA